MKISPERLKEFVRRIFDSAGCQPAEAECIADHLIEANLAGHDSHGVIRVPIYVKWIGEGKVLPNQKLLVVFETDVLAVVDGRLGFGQSIGVQVMELGIRKAREHGLAAVALRNSAHLGRIGHWAEMAVRAGLVSLHFVNTNGLGMLVAPVGGIERRLSANPVAVGIPVDGTGPIIFDISTSAIAEGKIKVAHNRGVPVPEHCIIDAGGNPTNDPNVFYGDPPGAILPFGGHKGYGLGLVTEMLAGALCGGGCSRPGKDRLEQGMFTVLLNPTTFRPDHQFMREVREFVDFVKSSKRAGADEAILMPGEPEARCRESRAEGIDIDATTWKQLKEAALTAGVAPEVIDATESS